jgi:opacity protein-like surface antigen
MTSRHPGIAAVAVIAGLSGTAAQAQDRAGVYVEAFGGASMLRDTDIGGAVAGAATFGTGPVVGGALGYDTADLWFRPEIEFAYRSGDADSLAGGASGDFASTTLMLNAYHDFDRVGTFTPYIGIGAGYVTEIDFDIAGGAAPGEYSDRGGFAWQAMAGAGYAVTDRIGLSGELRYFDAGSRTLADPARRITADHATVELVLGARYRF